MNKLIEKLDELMHDEIVFPDFLVRNMRIPGYEELKYTKDGDMLYAVFTYRNDYGKIVLFRYAFDKDDKLIKVEIDEGGSITTLFDRNQEMSDTRASLRNQLASSKMAV